MKLFRISLISLFMLFVILSPLYHTNAALVPCGDTEADKCTICDLVVGAQNIINFFLELIFAGCILMLTVGGVMYIASAGNQQMVSKAKSAITAAIIGIIIVLTAFLLIRFIMIALSTKDDAGGVGISGLTTVGNSWEVECKK